MDMKLQKVAENKEMGLKWDVDFQLMVERERAKVKKPESHKIPDISKINIWIRKRPLFQKEAIKGEIDIASVTNPAIIVHKCKFKVDGITKYVDNDGFEFDNTFSEFESSDAVYYASIQPQIDFLFDGGIVTCFAYGQTGSGKTYTMEGVQKLAVNDFFAGAEIMKEETGRLFTFTVSYYEIYNGKVFDLLDNHKQKKVQEDRSGTIQIPGLKEVQAKTPDEMTQLIEYGLSERKTKSTAWNDTSSRSHAIGTISIKEINKRNQVIGESGKLLLVDLAGSEKAQDSQNNNKQRRIEGAEINTSLLSLKECIRAMESSKKHIPFRQSKLTMVLRDSFIGGKNKTHVIMIACISPDQSSGEHTLNTLRYAERLKEGSDDDEILDKYVTSKVSKSTDKLYENDYINYESLIANEIITKRSEDNDRDYDEPSLYESHEISVNLDQDVKDDIEEDHETELKNIDQFKNTNYNESRKPINYQYENQTFNDSNNLIEYNKGVTRTYERNYSKQTISEVPKHIEPEASKAYESGPKDYYRNIKTNETQRTIDDQNRYKRSYEREYQSYKRMYTEQQPENDDQIMQVESDGSDEHHSPQMYISSNKESSFTKHLRYSNLQNIEYKPNLGHSSSNNRLRYKIDIRPSQMNYLKNITTSSASSIGNNYQKPKPVASTDLGNHDKNYLNKTSYEISHRSKPMSQTIAYNARPVAERRYDNEVNKIIDYQKYNDYFRSDLI